MKKRITVHKLRDGATTEGAWYARVDGANVGDAGRAFWQTREQAFACGVRFLTKVIEAEKAA